MEPACIAEPVTEEEVLEVQKNWAAAIANISAVHKEGGDYIAAAGKAAGELYAYGKSEVMFKPTKVGGRCKLDPGTVTHGTAPHHTRTFTHTLMCDIVESTPVSKI